MAPRSTWPRCWQVKGGRTTLAACCRPYASQTAFAAAFGKLTDGTQPIGGRAFGKSNRSTGTTIALAQFRIQFARPSRCPLQKEETSDGLDDRQRRTID